MSRITEKRDVQDQLINYLSCIGWTFIPQSELPANLEGNEQFLFALRNQWTAYDDAQQREHNVFLIDYENLTNNTFHFIQEVALWDSKVDTKS